MSSFTPDLGDAVQPDGTLKDASEIIWSYDADDSIPFPSDNASGPRSGSSRGHSPATVVASVRRTTRVSRPSRRVLEELEAAEAASSAPTQNVGANHKCKAISALPDHRARKAAINVVSDDDSDDDSDGGSPSPPPTEPVLDDYESLKAMADANNQVSSLPDFIIVLLI